jgi:hypothetical protein
VKKGRGLRNDAGRAHEGVLKKIRPHILVLFALFAVSVLGSPSWGRHPKTFT